MSAIELVDNDGVIRYQFPYKKTTQPVSKPAEKTPTEIDIKLDKALKDCDRCTNVASLEDLWKNYPELHTNDVYKAKVFAVKASLTKFNK